MAGYPELTTLTSKKVWNETPLHKGKPTVTSQRAFAKKFYAKSQLLRYKVRLVARSSTQIPELMTYWDTLDKYIIVYSLYSNKTE